MTPISHDPDDLHAAAQTVLGEARGEDERGQRAVAAVIRNRVRDDRWPDTPRDVCHEPWQFSAWNETEGNVANLRVMAMAGMHDPAYRRARALAAGVFAGVLDDPTGGATHYHTRSITPDWADPDAKTAEIGAHVFYAL